MTFPLLPQLETARLRLRKLTAEDAEVYYQHLGSSEAVTRYMLWEPHRDVSQSLASIQRILRRYEAGRCYRWAIALKETNELIGIIELLRFDEENGSCSFAYMLGERFWGLGYGTETLREVFSFAFMQMDVIAITADHFAVNAASGRVMEKAGMRRSRVLPEKYEKHGIRYDAVEYRITQEQWNDQNRAGS